jgi:phage repressor protein C with HTH and peptisase S24 domain
MPAAASPNPVSTKAARFSILSIQLACGDLLSAGVLIEDPQSDRLYVRLRRDWERIAGEEAEVLSELEHGMRSDAEELGAARVLEQMESTLSNTLRVSDRREIMIHDFEKSLARLYREHVHGSVEPFVTHLPRYSLAVAAGKFLENREVESEGWEEAPAGLKLTDRMFVAGIEGRSMEPRIPDGSLCVFRLDVTGSRQGRLVLVEALGRGFNDRYSVKRYTSRKVQNADGTWEHERIMLEPLNPEFEAWDLEREDEQYRIIAEFVAVLD